MFEKTLIDLVKGIRVHADKESEYISKCLAEIKKELKVGWVVLFSAEGKR